MQHTNLNELVKQFFLSSNNSIKLENKRKLKYCVLLSGLMFFFFFFYILSLLYVKPVNLKQQMINKYIYKAFRVLRSQFPITNFTAKLLSDNW